MIRKYFSIPIIKRLTRDLHKGPLVDCQNSSDSCGTKRLKKSSKICCIYPYSAKWTSWNSLLRRKINYTFEKPMSLFLILSLAIWVCGGDYRASTSPSPIVELKPTSFGTVCYPLAWCFLFGGVVNVGGEASCLLLDYRGDRSWWEEERGVVSYFGIGIVLGDGKGR